MNKHNIIQTLWAIFWALMTGFAALFVMFGACCCTQLLATILYLVSIELTYTDYQYALEKGIKICR